MLKGRNNIKKAAAHVGAAKILFINKLSFCEEIFVGADLKSFLDGDRNILHGDGLGRVEGVLGRVILTRTFGIEICKNVSIFRVINGKSVDDHVHTRITGIAEIVRTLVASRNDVNI